LFVVYHVCLVNKDSHCSLIEIQEVAYATSCGHLINSWALAGVKINITFTDIKLICAVLRMNVLAIAIQRCLTGRDMCEQRHFTISQVAAEWQEIMAL